jgi:hypothetical protein
MVRQVASVVLSGASVVLSGAKDRRPPRRAGRLLTAKRPAQDDMASGAAPVAAL